MAPADMCIRIESKGKADSRADSTGPSPMQMLHCSVEMQIPTAAPDPCSTHTHPHHTNMCCHDDCCRSRRPTTGPAGCWRCLKPRAWTWCAVTGPRSARTLGTTCCSRSCQVCDLLPNKVPLVIAACS
jgi:hypothetical protein